MSVGSFPLSIFLRPQLACFSLRGEGQGRKKTAWEDTMSRSRRFNSKDSEQKARGSCISLSEVSPTRSPKQTQCRQWTPDNTESVCEDGKCLASTILRATPLKGKPAPCSVVHKYPLLSHDLRTIPGQSLSRTLYVY